MSNIVFDRFGRELILTPDREGSFTVTVEVVPSPQFFAWLTGLGAPVKILSPQPIVQQFCDYLQSVLDAYR